VIGGDWNRPRLLLIAAVLAVVLAAAALIGFAVDLQRQASREYARRAVVTLAATMKQHSELLFRTVDRAMTLMVRRMGEGMTFEDAAVGLFAVADVRSIALIDADDRVLAVHGFVDIQTVKRLAVEAAPQRREGATIGIPVHFADTRGGEEWALPYRHRLPDGTWLVSLIGLAELETFYASLKLGPHDATGLLRRDGILLARFPRTTLGINARGSALVDAVIEGSPSSAVESLSRIDGVRRVSAFVGLDGYPVVAFVGLDMDVVNGFWTGAARGLIGAGAVLIGFIIALSVWLDTLFQRRRVAEALAMESRAVMTLVLDRAADGLLAVDAAGSVVAANPAAAELLGVEKNALIGRNAFESLPSGAVDALSSGDGTRVDTEMAPRLGDRVPVSVTAMAGEKGLRVITIHDRSEDIERSKRMAVLEKMRVIGQMTGGVAHDFNNILTIISLNLELVGSMIGESPIWENHMLPALRAARRGAQLTGHLLAFARRQPLAPEPIDTGTALLDFRAMMERSLGERWNIEIVHTATWFPLADAGQLEAAIVNLAINARDAMPNGGRILVESRDVTIDADYAAAVGELKPGDYVLIAVNDEGTGIPPETLARVFEPFFTTKPAGKGSGLGLSMVFGFAKQSNGHVTIYSEVGAGTTVKLYLPRAPERDVVASRPMILNEDEMPSMRILVVEDDAEVRMTAVRALRGLGQTTIEAADADEALRLVAEGLRFDLLFTDVVLPGATGRMLADELRKARPDLRVLYTSGYTENAIVHHGRLDPNVVLLSKPYTRDALRSALRSAISDDFQSAPSKNASNAASEIGLGAVRT